MMGSQATEQLASNCTLSPPVFYDARMVRCFFGKIVVFERLAEGGGVSDLSCLDRISEVR